MVVLCVRVRVRVCVYVCTVVGLNMLQILRCTVRSRVHVHVAEFRVPDDASTAGDAERSSRLCPCCNCRYRSAQLRCTVSDSFSLARNCWTVLLLNENGVCFQRCILPGALGVLIPVQND